jgi:hypothetical protein
MSKQNNFLRYLLVYVNIGGLIIRIKWCIIYAHCCPPMIARSSHILSLSLIYVHSVAVSIAHILGR